MHMALAPTFFQWLGLQNACCRPQEDTALAPQAGGSQPAMAGQAPAARARSSCMAAVAALLAASSLQQARGDTSSSLHSVARSTR